MFRAIVCVLALAGSGATVRAGELDRDPAPAGKVPAAAPVAAGGYELDRESPQPAHGWRGYYGPYGGPGWGWGGYYPYGVSYDGFGFAPAYYPFRAAGFPIGYGGLYGGFGYAYCPFYPAYHSFGYGGWYW